jgi:hypothetical protein
MFDRERTIVELLADGTRPARALAAELIEMHREDIDTARLHEYARRLDITAIPEAGLSVATSLG